MTRPLRAVRDRWTRRTLRFRIALTSATVALASLMALAALTPTLVGWLLVDSADTQLHAALQRALSQVRHGVTRLPNSVGRQLRVLDTAGDPVDGRQRPRLDGGDVTALRSGLDVLRERDDPPHRWLGTVVSAPDGSQRLVVAGAGLVGYTSAQRLAQRGLLVAAVLGAAAVLAATWLAVRAALRPVQRMRAAARELPPGQRLPVPAAHDELRDLAEALNGLLARRDSARERLQRFTGDAAHELRSPVASIRAQAEVGVLYSDQESSAEVLADVAAEAERMSRLVSDLLVLARSDAGELPAMHSVDLAFAAEAAIRRLPDDGPSVRLEAPAGHCSALASPAEVQLVLDNLLRNGVRHARAAVTALVLPAGRWVRLVLDDDGDGIPAEHRSKVFDRFYRVADDRSRDSGGFGLGLALVAELVRRRGGTVAVGESPEGGARFDVRWPAACNSH